MSDAVNLQAAVSAHAAEYRKLREELARKPDHALLMRRVAESEKRVRAEVNALNARLDAWVRTTRVDAVKDELAALRQDVRRWRFLSIGAAVIACVLAVLV